MPSTCTFLKIYREIFSNEEASQHGLKIDVIKNCKLHSKTSQKILRQSRQSFSYH